MYEQLASNRRRSALLISAFAAVVIAAGYAIGYAWGVGPAGLIVATAVALLLTWTSYFAGARIVLAASRAREVTHEAEPRLHNLVEGLCIAAGLPKPRIYLINDPAPNAFATGRDPKHSSIAVTTGLLEKMNRVELEGVLGHELAHVRNRDTLVMALAATLVGIVVLIADWTMRSFWWGVGPRRRGGDRGGAAGLFVMVGVLFAVLMPIFARVMQLAISRRREYYADISGVQLTRYPPGLISALEKLRDDRTVVRTASRATAHLWIESPLDRSEGKLSRLNRMFDTHPPLEDRIRILKEL